MRSSFIYRGAVVWNALPNAVKDSGSLSAFRINLKRHIRTLWISTCSPCIIVVVLFNQGLVEKQLFITDERVTLNKYISNQKSNYVNGKIKLQWHSMIALNRFTPTTLSATQTDRPAYALDLPPSSPPSDDSNPYSTSIRHLNSSFLVATRLHVGVDDKGHITV